MAPIACSSPIAGQRESAAPRPRAVTPRGPLHADEQAMITLFEKARASVVYITTQTRVVDTWTRNMFSVPRGTGSGFVWDERGHIVTNFRVVSGASGARVRLSDRRDADATLVGVSPAHDLAVMGTSSSPSTSARWTAWRGCSAGWTTSRWVTRFG